MIIIGFLNCFNSFDHFDHASTSCLMGTTKFKNFFYSQIIALLYHVDSFLPLAVLCTVRILITIQRCTSQFQTEDKRFYVVRPFQIHMNNIINNDQPIRGELARLKFSLS